MKTTSYKYFLLTTVIFVAITAMAQPKKDSTLAFKEFNKDDPADNFTIRKIKKKELEIAPSKIVLLNTSALTDQQKSKRKKKKND